MPDVDNAISKMKDNNFLILNAHTDLLFVGFRSKNISFPSMLRKS